MLSHASVLVREVSKLMLTSPCPSEFSAEERLSFLGLVRNATNLVASQPLQSVAKWRHRGPNRSNRPFIQL